VADKLARTKLARAALRLNRESALPALVLMTDDARLADPLAAARALPRGSMVIVRSRDGAKRTQLIAALKPIARARELKLIAADDPALAMKADGLHLPEAKAAQAVHWRARHPRWIITSAAHCLSAIARARHADAVFLSPIFTTQSHPEKAYLGAARARFIARSSPRPLYALGGIDAHNAQSLRGFAGIAAIGALA
jgi:thiamine-phosphate pyrophosphorylase